MIFLRVLLILFITFIVASCSVKQIDDVGECNFPDNPDQVSPMWLCGEDIVGSAIYVVGSSSDKGTKLAKRKEALNNATLTLKQQMLVSLEGNFDSVVQRSTYLKKEAISNIYIKFQEYLNTHELVRVTKYKEAISNKGVLYVAIGYDKKIYGEVIKNELYKVYQNHSAELQGVISYKSFLQFGKDLYKEIGN
jgi:hypothetical protein